MLGPKREHHIAIIHWYSNGIARFVVRERVIGVPKLRLEGEGAVLHGSLSTYCRILLLLAPSRAIKAPSRGDSTSFTNK